MKTGKTDLLTAGAIALKLGKPVPKVKQAIADLKIKPTAKKGACSCFSSDVVPKIKSTLK